MHVCKATALDIPQWLSLAAEVEHLFGPMTGEPAFHRAIQHAIDTGQAFCIRDHDGIPGTPLCGAISVHVQDNRIEWLAVASRCRGKGAGKALLLHALGHLRCTQDITVQTFAAHVPEGIPARTLYLQCGFQDHHAAEMTPAGIATVVMVRASP